MKELVVTNTLDYKPIFISFDNNFTNNKMMPWPKENFQVDGKLRLDNLLCNLLSSFQLEKRATKTASINKLV